MNLEENIKNVETFLKPKKLKVSIIDGTEHEYDREIGMFYAMETISCLIKIFSFTDIKIDDFFGEKPNVKNYNEIYFAQNMGKAVIQKEAREAFYEAISNIVKKDIDWVKNNITIFNGIGVLFCFFVLTSVEMKQWMNPLIKRPEPTELDSEKSSSGALRKEMSQ